MKVTTLKPLFVAKMRNSNRRDPEFSMSSALHYVEWGIDLFNQMSLTTGATYFRGFPTNEIMISNLFKDFVLPLAVNQDTSNPLSKDLLYRSPKPEEKKSIRTTMKFEKDENGKEHTVYVPFEEEFDINVFLTAQATICKMIGSSFAKVGYVTLDQLKKRVSYSEVRDKGFTHYKLYQLNRIDGKPFLPIMLLNSDKGFFEEAEYQYTASEMEDLYYAKYQVDILDI